jgi:hypothetical protein
MTAEEELRHAEQARQIIETPIVKDTLDMMERELYEAWLSTPARDPEGRDWIWRQAVVTRKFRDVLLGTMEMGKLAQEKIKQQKEAQKSVTEKMADLYRNWRA